MAGSEVGCPNLLDQIKAIIRRGPDAQAANEICAGVDGMAASRAPIVCVGPTKAGKSTLVNAIFGRLIVPSGALPETVLPVAFASEEFKDGDAEGAFYSIGVGTDGGDGLDEFLGVSGDTLTRLSAHETFLKVSELNSRARCLIGDYPDFAEFTDRFPHFYRWRLEVSVPRSAYMDVTLIDCPGGSEHGVLGEVIKALLQHQVEQAFLALFVVRADNITPLQDCSQVENFFGGTSQNKDAVVVLNAVEKPEIKEPALRFMQEPLTKDALSFLRVERLFFMSGQVLLANRLASLLPKKTMASVLADAGPSLEAYKDKFEEAPHNSVDFFMSMPPDEAKKVLKELGLKPGHIQTLLKKGLTESVVNGMPAVSDAAFETCKSELQVIFKTIYASLEFDTSYSDVREQLPELVKGSFDAAYADTASFLPWFQGYISHNWQKLIKNYMLDAAMQKSKEVVARLRHQARVAACSREEAQASLQSLRERCVPDKMVSLRSKISMDLRKLLSGRTTATCFKRATKRPWSVEERIARAAMLFGTKEEDYLKFELIQEVLDVKVAHAWIGLVEMPDKVGQPDLLNRLTGEDSHVKGRLLKTRECAERLVSEFMDWCSKLVTEAFLEGGAAQLIVTQSANEWLMSEKVAECVDLSGWICEIRELHPSVAPHLSTSASKTVAQQAAGALGSVIFKPMSWSGVFCRERIASFTRLTANQFYLGEVPALFPSSVEPLGKAMWLEFAEGIERAATEAIAATAQESVLKLMQNASEDLLQRIDGGQEELAKAQLRVAEIEKSLEALEALQAEEFGRQHALLDGDEGVARHEAEEAERQERLGRLRHPAPVPSVPDAA